MLAIVIPYYNMQFFEETLNSLKEQTDKRFTVYIGNDGSKDNPKFLIEKFSNEFTLVYNSFVENVGQYSLVRHWSRCIDLMQDEKWIQVLGDDDVLTQNFVAQFYEHLNKIERHKSNVVRFASQKINSKGCIQSKKYKHPQKESATDAFYKVFKKETRSSLSEYIFKKEVYEKYEFQDFPLAWFSDTMAWLDFSEGKPIYTINDGAVFVRFSEISISGKIDNLNQKYKSTYLFYKLLIQKHFTKFSKKQQEEIFKEYANYVQVTRSYTWNNWRMIVWNALKKLDLNTVKIITRKTYIANKK